MTDIIRYQHTRLSVTWPPADTAQSHAVNELVLTLTHQAMMFAQPLNDVVKNVAVPTTYEAGTKPK